MNLVYFDNAAATPVDSRVLSAMQPYLTDVFYNPSSVYAGGRQANAALNEAKHTLAMAIGAQANDIYLTAGATESVNMAIYGVVNSYGGKVVLPNTEHQAVMAAAARHSYAHVAASEYGYVSPQSITEAIDDQTVLVTVGYANSELGTVQPLADIAAAIAKIRQSRKQRGIDLPIFLHSDASQAAGYLDLSVARLGVDLLTLNAGKCYGPKQTGLLWVRPGIKLSPLILGGGQENGLRSGTQNVAGAVGFALALKLAGDGRKDYVTHVAKMRDALQTGLQQAFEDLVINGHPKKRLASHLHVSLPGLDGERAVFALDLKGIMVSTGSACAANKGLRSHVLTNIGLSADLADGSLRFSLGRNNTMEQIQQVLPTIIETLRAERQLS